MKKVCLLFLSIVFFLSCMAQEKTDSIDTDSINKKEIVENNHSSASSWNKASDNQRVDNMGFVSVLLISAGVSLVVGCILGVLCFILIKSSHSELNKRIVQRKSEIKTLEGRLNSIAPKIERLEFEFKKLKTPNHDNSKLGEIKTQDSKIVAPVASSIQNIPDVKAQKENSTPNPAPTSVDSSKEQIEDSEVIKKVKKKLYADSPGEGGDVFRDVFSGPKNSSMFVITYCEGETTGEFTLMDSAAAINRFIESIDVHSKNTANYVGSGMTINQDLTVPGTVELTPDKKWQIKEKMNLKFE